MDRMKFHTANRQVSSCIELFEERNMFIKSFFAEPAAVVRPRLIVSAAGRVLAALFIAAAGLMVSAQSAFAQLQQGASLRYHATLVNSPSPSVEDARGESYTDPMIVLKHIQVNNKPEIADFEVDDPANPGQRIITAAERNKYKILRLYTPKSNFISAIRARPNSNGNPGSGIGTIGTNVRQLQRDGKTYIQTELTSANAHAAIHEGQYNIVLDLFKNHGFVHGDEIEVRVAKEAESNGNPAAEETLFTMVLHLLDFGTDDDIYTVNAKAGESSSRDYPLAELPANSQGVGTLEYKLIGGNSPEPSFSTSEYDFDNDAWGSGTEHITGSRRNFLRVSGSNGMMTSRATSPNAADENVYYYVKDVNDVVIRRPYNFYLIAGLEDDDVDDSIPTFEQRMWCGKDNCGVNNGIHGRIRVYAREIFGPDASRLELARPASTDRATYFALRARKRIGPSNTADVTISLVGA
ncbi:hypothetical protein, partial [Thioalkalivibrio sp. HK1]|uniref:hypothetical protein n=1 Tax=Thioalkalivibrio sp. HK1 TaxID=1469245 RepID=UPI00056EE37B